MDALLADLILAVHFAFVAFVVVGLVAIPIGGLARWSWVREPWWRWSHLLGMAIVAVQAALQVPCFLTVWEYDLRRAGGAPADGRSFIVRLMDDVLFYELNAEQQRWLWAVYIALFVLLVVATAVVRPRAHPWWTRWRESRGRG